MITSGLDTVAGRQASGRQCRPDRRRTRQAVEHVPAPLGVRAQPATPAQAIGGTRFRFGAPPGAVQLAQCGDLIARFAMGESRSVKSDSLIRPGRSWPLVPRPEDDLDDKRGSADAWTALATRNATGLGGRSASTAAMSIFLAATSGFLTWLREGEG